MYMPKGVLEPAKMTKHAQRQEDINIFKDKVVSKVKSPYLNNIEIGLAVTDQTLSGISQGQKTENVQPVRRIGANNLLTRINIVRVNLPKEFSLLSETAATSITQNNTIFEKKEFANTFNIDIDATDKFANSADPFYVLDGGSLDASTYNAEKDKKGNIMEQVDLSKIAAGMVSLNVSDNYKGRSKYFTADIKDEI